MSDPRPEWQQVQTCWLTIAQAPFFFSPDYVSPGKDFGSFIYRNVRAMAQPIAGVEVARLSDFVVAIRREQVQVIVDGTRGGLRLGHRQRGWSLCVDGVSDIDWRLCFDIDTPELWKIDPRYQQDVLALSSIASSFVSVQRRNFVKALEAGLATIVGRWNNLTTPFQTIELDKWRYFRFDEEASIARSILTNDIIFSPMIAPRARCAPMAPESTLEPVMSWLVDKMRRNAERPRPKEALLLEARIRWPALSERKFFDLWKPAISISGAASYGKPGRRK